MEAKRAAVPLTDWAFHSLPCPLLEDGRCGVYAVRPFVCRSVTSFNVEPCKARAEKPGGPVSIPAHALIRAIARAAMSACMRAAEAAPGKGGTLDLARALQAALALPDAAKRWIGGAPLFDKALARVAPQVVKKPLAP